MPPRIRTRTDASRGSGRVPSAGPARASRKAPLSPEDDSGDASDETPDAPDATSEVVELLPAEAPEDRSPATAAVIVEVAEPVEALPASTGRSAVQRFLAEARRYPRLTEEDERVLIRAVRERNDQNAARKLVVHNLRLVVSIAYQYRQAWTNVLDLFQEGSVGLLEAVKRWDPDLGTRFGSYAAYWIRAFVLRFLMTNGRLIHVGNTRAGRKLFFRLERERQKLLAAGFDVTPKLLAARLDVDEKDIEEVSAHLASREVSIEPRPDEEGVSLGDRLAGSGASPETEAARSELASTVAELTRRFDESLTSDRERAVWREHLATPEEPVALSVLGERFGVTKQRMGQIADQLKARFRALVLAEVGSEIQLAWQQEDGH